MATLKSKRTMLKQNLKTNTKKLKYQKEIIECKKINKRCYKDPQSNEGLNHHYQNYSV